MTYLETQLERMTTACMSVQGYNERMDQMTGQITSVEERIVNLTRMIKLLQTSADTHEQESAKLKEELKEAERNFSEIKSKNKTIASPEPERGTIKIV